MERKQLRLSQTDIDRVTESGEKEGVKFSEMLRRIISWYFESRGLK